MNIQNIAIEGFGQAIDATPRLGESAPAAASKAAWEAAVWVVNGLIEDQKQFGTGYCEWGDAYHAAEAFDFGHLDARLNAFGADPADRRIARDLMFEAVADALDELVVSEAEDEDDGANLPFGRPSAVPAKGNTAVTGAA